MKPSRKSSNNTKIALSPDETAIFDELSNRDGIPRSVWMRIASRRLAEQELEKLGRKAPWLE